MERIGSQMCGKGVRTMRLVNSQVGLAEFYPTAVGECSAPTGDILRRGFCSHPADAPA